jgi:hypothetical protein
MKRRITNLTHMCLCNVCRVYPDLQPSGPSLQWIDAARCCHIRLENVQQFPSFRQVPCLGVELCPGIVQLTGPVFKAFVEHCDLFAQFVTAPLTVDDASLDSTEFLIQFLLHTLHNDEV